MDGFGFQGVHVGLGREQESRSLNCGSAVEEEEEDTVVTEVEGWSQNRQERGVVTITSLLLLDLCFLCVGGQCSSSRVLIPTSNLNSLCLRSVLAFSMATWISTRLILA
jgi:hypothetical protein